MPQAAIDRLLDAWPIAHLATVRPSGGPHIVPIVFARWGGYLWTPIDGKPKVRQVPQRIRNIRAHARVTLSLDDYNVDWSCLWWIRVDGEATTIADGAEGPSSEAAPALAALRRKYPQYRTTSILDDSGLLIRIAPTRITSWRADAARIPTPRAH